MFAGDVAVLSLKMLESPCKPTQSIEFLWMIPRRSTIILRDPVILFKTAMCNYFLPKPNCVDEGSNTKCCWSFCFPRSASSILFVVFNENPSNRALIGPRLKGLSCNRQKQDDWKGKHYLLFTLLATSTCPFWMFLDCFFISQTWRGWFCPHNILSQVAGPNDTGTAMTCACVSPTNWRKHLFTTLECHVRIFAWQWGQCPRFSWVMGCWLCAIKGCIWWMSKQEGQSTKRSRAISINTRHPNETDLSIQCINQASPDALWVG